MSIYITDSNGKRYLIAGTAAPVVDAALDSNSIAAVQNRVVAAALNTKVNKADMADFESLRILPQEYQEVEYIESTGTQYINTGYVTKYGDTVEIEFEYTTINNTFNFIYGATTPTNAEPVAKFGVRYYNSAYVPIMEIVGATYLGTSLYAFNKKVYKMVLTSGSQKLYIDGVEVAVGTESAALPNYTALLFASNNGNNAYVDGNQSNGKLYKATIKSGSTLVRNFVPCYRKLDGVIGLYDLVNNSFYTNQGTGTFLKGADICLSNVARRTDPQIQFAESERQKSKNLFDYKSITDYNYGVTNNGDGSFTINTQFYYPLSNVKIPLKREVTYTYSLNVDSYSDTGSSYITVEIVLQAPEDTQTVYKAVTGTGRMAMTFTPKYDVESIDVRYIRKNNNTSTLNARISNIQLEEGSVATDYQPYNGAPVHEKEAERYELVYDKAIRQTPLGGTLAYTKGIYGTVEMDLSKYRFIRVYYGHNNKQYTMIINCDIGQNGSSMQLAEDTNILATLVKCTKTSFTLVKNGYYVVPSMTFNDRTSGSDGNGTYSVYRIEGVY